MFDQTTINSSIWSPSVRFRWVERNCHYVEDENGFASVKSEKVLQQLHTNNNEDRAWVDVPVEFENESI